MNHGDDGKTCGGREVVISPRWWRQWKKRDYTQFGSTFRDGRRPLRNKLYASPYMSSIPRQGGRREDLDNEMVGLGCGT